MKADARGGIVTAAGLLNLLAIRHAGDLFVPECKDGPTQSKEHLRLDAWAMRRSWANQCFDGYETKVSRSDWKRDAKFLCYLPLCNRLWVVCPSGLIEPEEVPAEVGLLWAPKCGGNRLVTKRKAPFRAIEPPADLLLYVLMCRVRVAREVWGGLDREERARLWAKFNAGEAELRTIGHHASRRLREEIRRVVDESDARARRAEKEREDAVAELAKLRAFRDLADEFGLLERRVSIWDLRRSVEGVLAGGRVRENLDALRSSIERATAALDAIARETSGGASGSAIERKGVCHEVSNDRERERDSSDVA